MSGYYDRPWRDRFRRMGAGWLTRLVGGCQTMQEHRAYDRSMGIEAERPPMRLVVDNAPRPSTLRLVTQPGGDDAA